MEKEKRNQIIAAEIDKAIDELTHNTWLSGFGCHSDIFQLPDGREVQIQVNVTVDEDEIDEPTNTFINAT